MNRTLIKNIRNVDEPYKKILSVLYTFWVLVVRFGYWIVQFSVPQKNSGNIKNIRFLNFFKVLKIAQFRTIQYPKCTTSTQNVYKTYVKLELLTGRVGSGNWSNPTRKYQVGSVKFKKMKKMVFYNYLDNHWLDFNHLGVIGFVSVRRI